MPHCDFSVDQADHRDQKDHTWFPFIKKLNFKAADNRMPPGQPQRPHIPKAGNYVPLLLCHTV